MICYLYPEPTYFFFAKDIPELLYYSHIPATAVALFVGLFVLLNNPKKLLNQLLFLLCLSFSVWTISSLTAWTNINADLLAAIWPLFAIATAFISILSVYLALVFLHKKDVSFSTKLVFFFLLTPVLLLAHTNLNISGFDLATCDAFGYEGLLYKGYYTALGFMAIVWIAIASIQKYRFAKTTEKTQILLMSGGTLLFLALFITTTFVITFFVNIGLLPDSRLEMYGLFGMMFFMTALAVLISKFRAFNVGLLTSQILVFVLTVLVASQFTYSSTTTAFTLKAVTLVLTLAVGLVLIRSIKNDVQQKNEIKKLLKNLEKANARLKFFDKQKSEFVSIASHQLRSPLTAIRGYASLLLEGSFGTIPQKSVEPLSRIDESAKLMALAIEDYLNVSRIEAGNMKYHLADFNLPTEVEHITDDVRANAIKKGLVLYYKKSLHNQGVIHADKGKTVQIIHNLIDNAVKYTVKGTITVLVRDDIKKKKIFVDVIDTGIGMDDKTQDNIFQKFGRADNANSVNISGTGLGLFVAHKMAEAMGGDITAHSKGDDQGSRFTLELPLAM
jgi:signal transduction histidine kinase